MYEDERDKCQITSGQYIQIIHNSLSRTTLLLEKFPSKKTPGIAAQAMTVWNMSAFFMFKGGSAEWPALRASIAVKLMAPISWPPTHMIQLVSSGGTG